MLRKSQQRASTQLESSHRDVARVAVANVTRNGRSTIDREERLGGCCASCSQSGMLRKSVSIQQTQKTVSLNDLRLRHRIRCRLKTAASHGQPSPICVFCFTELCVMNELILCTRRSVPAKLEQGTYRLFMLVKGE